MHVFTDRSIACENSCAACAREVSPCALRWTGVLTDQQTGSGFLSAYDGFEKHDLFYVLDNNKKIPFLRKRKNNLFCTVFGLLRIIEKEVSLSEHCVD